MSFLQDLSDSSTKKLGFHLREVSLQLAVVKPCENTFFSDLVVVWNKELHGCPSLPHISILEESATFFYFFLQDRASYSGRSSTESAGGLGRQVLDNKC